MARKKVLTAKKHDKRPAYHFICGGCKLELDLRANGMTEAQNTAFNRHDEWHTKNGSFCESNSFELAGPA
jgi:hypothetical protein